MISLGITLGDLEPTAADPWLVLLRDRFQLICKPIPNRTDGAVQVTGTAEQIENAVSHLRGEGIGVEPLEL